MSQQVAQDAAAVGVKAAPGVVVAATGATGAINWSDIAYMLTAFYMVAQILLLLPQYRRMLTRAMARKKQRRKLKREQKEQAKQ